jgi:hypothetical protein
MVPSAVSVPFTHRQAVGWAKPGPTVTEFTLCRTDHAELLRPRQRRGDRVVSLHVGRANVPWPDHHVGDVRSRTPPLGIRKAQQPGQRKVVAGAEPGAGTGSPTATQTRAV